MRCDICNEREASVFVHQLAKGGNTELRLCVRCAMAHGLNVLEGDISGSLEKLLTTLPGTEHEEPIGKAFTLSACPICGLSQEEIKGRRSAGCSQCWELFTELLHHTEGGIPLPRHRGRYSLSIERSEELERERRRLQDRLDAAVASEAYEEAASVRDALLRLGKKRSGHE